TDRIQNWEIGASVIVSNPTDQDCPLAAYLREEPPHPELAPPLDPLEVPPAEVEGLGMRIAFGMVPRTWDDLAGGFSTTNVVPPSFDEPDPVPVYATVIACPELEVQFLFSADSCDEGIFDGFPAEEWAPDAAD